MALSLSYTLDQQLRNSPPPFLKEKWGIMELCLSIRSLYPPQNEVLGGVYWFHSVRPSVRPSVDKFVSSP